MLIVLVMEAINARAVRGGGGMPVHEVVTVCGIVAFFAWVLGYHHCRLVLRAIVSDECGKEVAQRVFGEKPTGGKGDR